MTDKKFACKQHAIRYSLDDLRELDYNGKDWTWRLQFGSYKCSTCDEPAKYEVLEYQ